MASLKRPLTFLQRRVGGVFDARVLTVLLTTVCGWWRVPIRRHLAARGGGKRIQGSCSAASDPPADMLAKLVLPVAVVSALVARSPTEAWYKQVAGPSYYPVGRASGLLSGIRRWPYVRRVELEPTDGGGESAGSDSALTEATPQNNLPLKTMVSAQPALWSSASEGRAEWWITVPLRTKR